MRFIQAIVSFGLFGYLDYATLLGTLGAGSNGAISRLIGNAIDLYSRNTVGLALLAFGAALAALRLLLPKRQKKKKR